MSLGANMMLGGKVMMARASIASAAMLTGAGTQFFSQGVDVVAKIIGAIGVGLGIYGAVQLFEGYANDNPGSKSQGLKQFAAGAGIVLIATQLFPLLKTAL